MIKENQMGDLRHCASLVLHQDMRHFNTDPDDGRRITARTLQPSAPHGGWPGTTIVIREWKICDYGRSMYRDANEKEIYELEQMLGEWTNVRIIDHPTLGLVSTPWCF